MHNLVEDVAQIIVGHLGLADRARLSRVDRFWRRVVNASYSAVTFARHKTHNGADLAVSLTKIFAFKTKKSNQMRAKSICTQLFNIVMCN
jgi:hypothetical protein